MFVQGIADVPELLPNVIESGDLLLTLGAGDVGSLPPALVQRYVEGRA